MPGLVPIKRALLSVSDKTDLAAFARELARRGAEIISTGGTARALADAGIPVKSIDELTGFPEILGGRVKTLHPAVHGALLAVRDDPAHCEALSKHGIGPIDLVCVNLYPFERTVASGDVSEREAIEQIDIGGPSMLRSASKNFEYVTVVTSPRQYDRVINELQANDGATTRAFRSELAATAFSRTAEYDAAIASFLGRRAEGAFPEVLRIAYVKAEDLRYGENPHQDAALYRDPASTGPTVVNAQQMHGKRLSYNNILDASAALELVKDLRRLEGGRVGAAIVKHTNACGAAMAPTPAEAVEGAIAGDPVAAFGGILAINRALDEAAADRLVQADLFLEVVLAPTFTDGALEILKQKSANVRLMAVGDRSGSTARKLDHRSIPGGMLAQDRDTRTSGIEQWRLAAGPDLDQQRFVEAAFCFTVVKHLKSNAIAIGGRDASLGPDVIRIFGVGPGMVDRVGACRLAAWKAGDKASGAIAASDAFFPFPDGPAALIEAGVEVLVQPGGSKRDDETFELCRERGVACLVTGVRHFRH